MHLALQFVATTITFHSHTLYTYLTLSLSLSLFPPQVELENWVNSIHSACAAAFARHRGKTGTLHLLQEEIFRLEKAIESVSECTSHPQQPSHATPPPYTVSTLCIPD